MDSGNWGEGRRGRGGRVGGLNYGFKEGKGMMRSYFNSVVWMEVKLREEDRGDGRIWEG